MDVLRGVVVMNKTKTTNVIMLLFQLGMIVALATQYWLFKALALVVFFPLAIFASVCIAREGVDGFEDDCRLTLEAFFVVVQGLIWDTAIKNGGVWLAIFAISVVLAFFVLFCWNKNSTNK